MCVCVCGGGGGGGGGGLKPPSFRLMPSIIVYNMICMGDVVALLSHDARTYYSIIIINSSCSVVILTAFIIMIAFIKLRSCSNR